MDTQSQSSFFDNVSIYFDQAASFTEYPKGLLDQIKVCNSVYSFKFPVRADVRRCIRGDGGK